MEKRRKRKKKNKRESEGKGKKENERKKKKEKMKREKGKGKWKGKGKKGKDFGLSTGIRPQFLSARPAPCSPVVSQKDRRSPDLHRASPELGLGLCCPGWPGTAARRFPARHCLSGRSCPRPAELGCIPFLSPLQAFSGSR